MRHPDSSLRPLLARRLAAVGVCALALTGCRGGGEPFARGGPPRGGDPLLGARIPPQDLPVPGPDGYASRGRKDPLLGTPTRTTGTDESTQPAKAKGKPEGSGVSRGGPYLPDKGSTNAALAGHLRPDDSDLSIGDRRPVAVPAGGSRGPVPFRPADDGDDDRVAAELRKYGATWDRPAVEGGQYAARVDVPLDVDRPGLVRRYEGVGATAAAALRDALDQIKTDKGGR